MNVCVARTELKDWESTLKNIALEFPIYKGDLSPRTKASLTILEKEGVIEQWFFLNRQLEIQFKPTRVHDIGKLREEMGIQ